MAQGGAVSVPGIASADFSSFAAQSGILGSAVLGMELGYLKRPWGGSFMLDVAPAGVPVPGSASITTQLNIGLGIHYESRWFNRRNRWVFVYHPFMSYVSRYSDTSFTHNGFGFGLESRIDGGKWGELPYDWVFAINWNRLGTSRVSAASSGTLITGELMGASGPSQLFYALAGIEMNFSVR